MPWPEPCGPRTGRRARTQSPTRPTPSSPPAAPVDCPPPSPPPTPSTTGPRSSPTPTSSRHCDRPSQTRGYGASPPASGPWSNGATTSTSSPAPTGGRCSAPATAPSPSPPTRHPGRRRARPARPRPSMTFRRTRRARPPERSRCHWCGPARVGQLPQRRYQRVCRRVRPNERDPVDLTGQLSNFRTPLDQAADQHFLRHSPAPAPAADRPDRQRRLGPDDIGRLVAGYNAGATAKDLAAEYGIHRRTVAAHLERAGVLRRRQGLVDPAKVREAGELYEQGWSTDRLAATTASANTPSTSPSAKPASPSAHPAAAHHQLTASRREPCGLPASRYVRRVRYVCPYQLPDGCRRTAVTIGRRQLTAGRFVRV